MRLTPMATTGPVGQLAAIRRPASGTSIAGSRRLPSSSLTTRTQPTAAAHSLVHTRPSPAHLTYNDVQTLPRPRLLTHHRPMTSILAAYPSTLSAWLTEQGQSDYRRRQIGRWLFVRRVGGFAEMTDLPARLRENLALQYSFWTTQIARHTQAADGTEKLLLRLADASDIECVLLRDGLRRTVCISSQVGCAMGCVFCASGLDGVKRNLTTGEILEQLLQLQRLLTSQERLSHVVVMGMGEPLANLDELLPALALANHPEGLGISARRITLSTVGLPPAIDRLARMKIPYHLAVSLHAPHDALRNQLVPVNHKLGLAAILQASERFFRATGRRVTFEYVLLAGINDREAQARELAGLLRGHNALVNVIPYNPVEGLPYHTPSRAVVQRFCSALQRERIQVQVRQRKGTEIQAACGQLRRATGIAQAPSPGAEVAAGRVDEQEEGTTLSRLRG